MVKFFVICVGIVSFSLFSSPQTAFAATCPGQCSDECSSTQFKKTLGVGEQFGCSPIEKCCVADTTTTNPGTPTSTGKACGQSQEGPKVQLGQCKPKSQGCSQSLDDNNNDCSAEEVCCADNVRPRVTVTDPATEPTSADAGACTDSPSEGWGPFSYKGSLVPCGRKCDDPQTATREDKDCTLCHMLLIVQNAFNLMKSVLFIVAIMMITVGGLLYVVSAGQSGTKTLAKGIITKTIMGFALFMLSWLIVMTLMSTLAYNSSVFSANGLFSYTCDATSAFEAGKTQNLGVGGTGPGGTPTGPSQPGTPGTCNGMSTRDGNVASQCTLASGALSGLLKCLKDNNVPTTITSLSAANVGSDFNKAKNCCGNESCTHASQTCHYGCTVSGQQGYSHAVDLSIGGKNEEQICQIAKSAKICGAGKIWGPRTMCGGDVIYQEGHTAHLHVSTSACNH